MQAKHLPWLVVGAGFLLGALGISVRQLLALAIAAAAMSTVIKPRAQAPA